MRVVLLVPLVLLGCGRATPPADAPADTPAAATPAPKPVGHQFEPEAAGMQTAARAAAQLGTTLKERLVSTMQAEGPAAAFEVCAGNAQGLTAAVSKDTGVDLGRSSLRLRNPKNEAPPWVQAWLDEQGERPAADAVGFERVDRVDGRRFARVLRPLPVAPPCLVCHGPAESLAPDVRAGLATHYPEDRAVGYAAGALRGALYGELALDAPPATP